jgi:50S ribosomal subunit-associated GTPase HflX
MEALREAIRDLVAGGFEHGHYRLPYDRYDLAALAHRTGRVIAEEHGPDGIDLRASVPPRTRNLLAPYRAQG